MPTTLSSMPENVKKYFDCALLHKKIPIMIEKEIEGKTVLEIVYVCKECRNEVAS